MVCDSVTFLQNFVKGRFLIIEECSQRTVISMVYLIICIFAIKHPHQWAIVKASNDFIVAQVHCLFS